VKIQDPLKQHPPFDIAVGQWPIYSEKGYIEIKPAQSVRPAGQLNWWVADGPIVGDYQYAPMLRFSCGECKTKGEVESPRGTAHQTTKVFHCGLHGQTCPANVAADYERKFAAWKARSKKPPVEKVSPHTPAYLVSKLGLKSREQLIAETVQLVKGPTNG
jgi:hypothetical protein